MRFMIALLPAALAACAGLAPIDQSNPAPLTADQIGTVRATITRDHFDPAAAQFRNLRAADVTLADGTTVRRVCGEVNGKNRLGGYVGFEMFGGVMTGRHFKRQDFFGPCE